MEYVAITREELCGLQDIKNAAKQLFNVRTDSPEWGKYLEELSTATKALKEE